MATRLLDEHDIANHHRPIESLTHVINRERSSRARMERFHLHPGRSRGLHHGLNHHRRFFNGEIDSYLAQQQWVAAE